MKFVFILFVLSIIALSSANNFVGCGEDDYDCEISKSGSKIIKLHEDNFVTLRGRVDEESSSQLISDMMKIKGDKIYLYLVTPGGSIVSGNSIIQTMDALSASGKEIICIADHAYSMGFVIFQACPTRYILEHSIIMQHQASLTLSGPLENVKNNLKLVEKIDKKANQRQSQRLGLTPVEFHEMTQHDMWLYADEILEYNAADEKVNVICNFDSDKTVTVTQLTFFGDIILEFSLCPLVHAPKKISFNIHEDKITEKVKQEFEKFSPI